MPQSAPELVMALSLGERGFIPINDSSFPFKRGASHIAGIAPKITPVIIYSIRKSTLSTATMLAGKPSTASNSSTDLHLCDVHQGSWKLNHQVTHQTGDQNLYSVFRITGNISSYHQTYREKDDFPKLIQATKIRLTPGRQISTR
jgi:hypothetical protein